MKPDIVVSSSAMRMQSYAGAEDYELDDDDGNVLTRALAGRFEDHTICFSTFSGDSMQP